MWRIWLRRSPAYALQGMGWLSIFIQCVRIVAEARTIIKVRKKRPPGFSSGLDFSKD